VTSILAALVARGRTGEGARIVISMTHGAHRLLPRTPVLTTGFACYSVYTCADGRHLTVAALEPKFFARLCELLDRGNLAERQYGDDQPALRAELAHVFATRTLAQWLEHFGEEDVCVGPGAPRGEADAAYGERETAHAPSAGEHTERWRTELGL
jgi:crotonobetainyl-CoA:carnitine CoA-transferase CaiB-like acyl-CoA transferase